MDIDKMDPGAMRFESREELIKQVRDLWMDSDKNFYHNVSVDIVILGYHERTLKVLLQKPGFSEDKWMLPGGYIRRTQTVEEAAVEVVRDRTRLTDLDLMQFHVFSRPGRNRGYEDKIRTQFEEVGIDAPKNFWIFDDFLSVGFFALTDYSKVRPSGSFYSEECRWFDIDALPPLVYDHSEIVAAALRRLRHHIVFHPIGYSLLPDKFTLPEIHSLYETILGRHLDERNFTKKLVGLGLIVKTRETRKIGPHRSPFLYIFDKARYDQLLREDEAILV